MKSRVPGVRFESREAAEYLSPGREPWVRTPSPRLRHPSPARAGEGKGEREGAPTHGFTPWATLCRSFGADFCWELRLQDTRGGRPCATSSLEILQHPHVAVYRVAQDRQVASIRRRGTPSPEAALLLPQGSDVAGQVDIEQRGAPRRRTRDVEALAVWRKVWSGAKTIPSVYHQVARRAACQRQQADAVPS